MSTARTSRGFTLIEVIVGTVLLSASSLFLMKAVKTYITVTTRSIASQNLTEIEKDIERNLVRRLTDYFTTTTIAHPRCNMSTQPLAAVFTAPLPSGIQLKLVTQASDLPDLPEASLYDQARTRCLAADYHGSFSSEKGIHGCVVAAGGDWTSTLAGSSLLNQTLLVEFTFTVRDEFTGGMGGGVVNCDSFVDYPMAMPPSNSSSLLTHLMVNAFAINARASQPNARGTLIARHITNAIRTALPYNPPTFSAITRLSLSNHGPHNAIGFVPPTGYLNTAFFSDCGGGGCNGRIALSASYQDFSTLTFHSVITALSLASAVPSGFSQIGHFKNCDGTPGCTQIRLASRSMNYSSMGSGQPILTGIWTTPLGTHSPDGLTCPAGFTVVGSFSDCGGGVCSGLQKICARFTPHS